MQVRHFMKLGKDDPMNSSSRLWGHGSISPGILQQPEGENDWLSDACNIIGLWCNEPVLGGTG
jgi:hypothetical protein